MFEALSLPAVLAVFAAAAAVIAVLGVRMTGIADRIADLTGLGEAMVGAVLLGAATSLSGTVVSITAALEGAPSLAFSNGVGGIAAQTAFLALADLAYRRANLEHAAAEVTSLFQAALLMTLLSLPLVAWTLPEVTVLGLHPVSVLLVVAFAAGVAATRTARVAPMWRPVMTGDTRHDAPEEPAERRGALRVTVTFLALMAVLALAGWVVARTGGEIAARSGLSETVVGALMTAVVTSLPELVTTLAAVRRGAMQLALGGIIGGNAFDTLFLAASDAAWREGSIYHAVGRADLMWVAVGLLMTGVLLMGLILRERDGPLRIGTESLLLLAIYAGAVAVQVALG